MQLTFWPGTAPLPVGVAKVQLTVSTRVPGGCSTVIVALVNARSVMSSVQLEFGQSGAPAIGDTGGCVVTLNGVVPFLISLAGMAWLGGHLLRWPTAGRPPSSERAVTG